MGSLSAASSQRADTIDQRQSRFVLSAVASAVQPSRVPSGSRKMRSVSFAIHLHVHVACSVITVAVALVVAVAAAGGQGLFL